MQQKLKTCKGCQSLKPIWKSHGKDKYCQQCWYSIEKPKSIRPVSIKMQATMDEYSKKRKAYLALNINCQAALPNCTKVATDVHHKMGRGEHHNNINTWFAVCRNCHTWITENSKEAIELGFSISRLKNDSEEL